MIKANVISGHSNWKKFLNKPNEYLKKRLYKLSKVPSFKRKNHEFSILLTSNKEMKKLNNKFRKKNKTTDVLSFPMKIKNKKRSNKTNFFLEFDKMWIHGYLHLVGYDHKKYNDFKRMLKKEKLILKYFH